MKADHIVVDRIRKDAEALAKRQEVLPQVVAWLSNPPAAAPAGGSHPNSLFNWRASDSSSLPLLLPPIEIAFEMTLPGAKAAMLVLVARFGSEWPK
jgi:hypothetical protein